MAALLFNDLVAQAPLSLDDSFQCSFNTWYVASVLPLDDGSILASGKMKFGSDLNFKNMMRFLPNGDRDLNFATNGAGGGIIKRWGDRLYVQVGQAIRRLHLNGELDYDFIAMSTQPLFSALQGGDYHVYPDGSLVMSGMHNLDDTARGFVGLYNLIWFTNTGHLDTTRTHRTGNGAIYEIEQLPDGKFLCSGTGTIYDGQPVRKVFRVHADGALDTTFDSQITWGDADSFLPLPDGRAYMVGICRRNGFPNDTIRVARLLPDGALDPTFQSALHFSVGDLPNALGLGAVVGDVQPWLGGDILLTGLFQYVNGQVRRGICVLDSSGVLQPEFDGSGVGTFVYQGTVTGSVQSIVLTPDNMLYVYGAYHGFSDGTTNDPDQRFITRLYGPDLTTAVSGAAVRVQASVRVAPNPTHGHFTLFLPADLGPAQARLLDASGRVVQHYTLPSGVEQQPLSTAAEAGTYLLLVEARDGQRWQARVVVE